MRSFVFTGKVLAIGLSAFLLEVGVRLVLPLPFAPYPVDLAIACGFYVFLAAPAALLGCFRRMEPLARTLAGAPLALVVANLQTAAGMHSKLVLCIFGALALVFGYLVSALRARALATLCAIACVPIAWHAFLTPKRTADTPRTSVLLIVLDTTSAAHLSTYGYGRPTSPNLSALAKHGLLYGRAIAPAPWTTPSHASIFTGRLPSELGFDGGQFRESFDGSIAGDLAATRREACGISANPILSGWPELAVGFDHFWTLRQLMCPVGLLFIDRLRHREGFDTHGGDLNRLALDWLDRVSARGRPWFLFLNYIDPHSPYAPPEPQRREFAPGFSPTELSRYIENYNTGAVPLTSRIREAMSALYDGEVAAVDLFVGELLAALHARGYDESNLLVIITADHGESLGNHGFVGHLLGLPDDVLHVPLILVGPHVPSGTITEHVQPLQLRATIRALLGMPAEPAIAPPLPPWGPAPDLLITEHPEPRWYLDGLGNFKKDFEPPPKWRGNWVAVERDGTKVVFDDHGRGATYDLRRDPGENDPQPLAAGAELVEAYRDRTSRLSKARAPELEQRTIEALRQLGYVHQ